MMYLIKKKISRKLKEFRSNQKHVRFYRADDAVIFIDLKASTKVRTYLNLIFRIRQFYQEPIVIKFSFFRYFILAKWFKELDYIYFSRPFSKIKIHRKFSHESKADFKIDYKYCKVYKSDEFLETALPYIMHPRNYSIDTPDFLPKSVGIVISGNFEEKIYNSTFISKFDMLNRWEIFQEISKHNSLAQITGDEYVEGLNSKKYNDKFVMMKWQAGAIPTEKWRHYLSASRFIFCAPGMTMPLCHNIIEAMSVGVIPIVNYQNWLNPSLENGVNCLTYETKDDIHKIIDIALKMPLDQTRILGENVTEYYKNYYERFDFEKRRHGSLLLVNENARDLQTDK